MTSPDVVLDASAVLALVRREPGGEAVRRRLPRAAMSVVNFAEVACVLRRGGMPEDAARRAIGLIVADPVPFTADHAWRTAEFHARTREAGLSFGDCACLALADLLGCPALTADRPWSRYDFGVPVEQLR